MSDTAALSGEAAPLSGVAAGVLSVSESLQAVLTTAPSNNKKLRDPLSHEDRRSGEKSREENQRDIMG